MKINSNFFTLIGILFIFLGLLFILAPFLSNYINLDDIPSWILYIYRGKNFYFVTSPLLILISVIAVIWYFFIH